MARPRKDGRAPLSAVRIGKERTTASGGTWRARGYAPTAGAPYGRVVYRKSASSKPTSAVPEDGESLDELFDRIERWLDQGVAIGSGPTDATGTGSATAGPRNIAALSGLYLAWLELRGCDPDYVKNRRSLINKWILPVIGKMPVTDWGVEESTTVVEAARPHVSAARLNDLGSVLSGLRATAHRKRAGGRWLSPDDNPLEGVEYGRAAGRQGASGKWVPVHKRPATDMVEKAIACAGEIGRWDWLPDAISISGFCAARQGELLGLRAIDVDLTNRELDVNGAWATPSSGQRAGQGKTRTGHRKPHPKNRMFRKTPYLGSQHEMLRRRVALALGLPEDTSAAHLAQLIEAERGRRANLSTTGDWRDVTVPAADEAWLCPGEDGVPPTKEQFNDAWHVVRDAVGWTRTIPYRNLRHHAALWWKANLPDVTWDTIAVWDGHDVRTLMAYYVIPSEDATSRARTSLDEL